MRRTFGLKVVAGSIAVGVAALVTGTAFAAAGDFDPSFNGTGTNQSDFDGSAVGDVTLQPDGKIVAVGTGETSGPPTDDEVAVVGRYTTAGALDPVFAGGMGIATGQYDTTLTRLLGVAIQPSPTAIVTAGFKEVGGSSTDTVGTIAEHIGAGAFAGVLNTGFAGDGVQDVIFTTGDPSRLHDVAQDPASGDFVAVGQSTTSDGLRYGIASVTSTGAFESGFGTGGSGKLIASPSFVVNGTDAIDDVANAVAIKPDSSLVVAGSSDPTAADGGANDDNDVSVQFLSATGSVGGATMTDVGGADTGADMVRLPDGKLLITGTTTVSGLDHFIMRLLSGGTPDPTFGDGGDGVFVQSAVGGLNSGDSLTVLPDGRIVVVGGTGPGGFDWVVARYTSAGLPDTSFDGDGSRVYDFSPDAGDLNAVTAQSDGKLVVGGSVASDWAVGRLLADDPPPVANPPVATPTPTATAAAGGAKKCKKGQKLRKGKCVKKKRKKRR